MKYGIFLVLLGSAAGLIGGGEADGRGFGGRGGGGFGGGRGGGGFGGRGGESGGGFGGRESGGGFGSSHSGGSGLDHFGGSQRPAPGGSRNEFGGGSGSRPGGFSGSGNRPAAGGRQEPDRVNFGGGTGGGSGMRGGGADGGRDPFAPKPATRPSYGGGKPTTPVGPHDRPVGGQGAAAGKKRYSSSDWQSAFAGGTHMSTDFGSAHYSSAHVGGARYSTSYRSASVVSAQATNVRGNFGYAGAFHASWYNVHPNCWRAAGWTAGTAWAVATWATVNSWCSIPAQPINYDYGNTVVINDNSVTTNGEPAGTPQEYAAQATAIAAKGETADAPPEAEWKPLGVFSLVQGNDQESNTVFQLAVSKAGVIRGNYYDGLMDTTTPVYGSADAKTQRAAWSIGKKTDRVFEAGLSNLTKDQAPVLVHLGKDRTQQWSLVRQEQQGEK